MLYNLLTLLLMVEVVKGGGSSKSTVDGVPDVTYSISQSDDPARPRRHPDWTMPKRVVSDNPCGNMREGLRLLTRGFNTYWFAVNATDSPPEYRSWFLFNCPSAELLDRGEHQVPIEIAWPYHDLLGIRHEWSDYYPNLGSLIEAPIKGSERTSTPIFLAAQANYLASINAKGTSARQDIVNTITTIRSEIFEVILNGEAKVVAELKEQFSSCLPIPGQDLDCHYGIISRYGTHVYKSATYGGHFHLSVLTEGPLDTETSPLVSNWAGRLSELVTENGKRLNKKVCARTTLFRGGDQVLSNTPDEWIRTIPKSPAIIAGEAIPLYKILDPIGHDRIRSDNMAKVIGGEENYFSLRKYQLAIPSLQGNAKIQEAVSRAVTEQLNYILPDPTVVSTVKKIVVSYSTLNQNEIYCKTDGGKQNILWRYEMVPGICVSNAPGKNFPGCGEVTKVTDGLNRKFACIKLYKQSKCEGGHDVFVDVTEPFKKDLIKNHNSFLVC